MKSCVGISGSRSFNNYHTFSSHLNRILKKIDTSCIITGDAKGVDQLAKRYAKENNIKLIELHADWKTFKKSAGFRLNQELINLSDFVICFWDGKSPGTKNTIEKCKQQKRRFVIINPFINLQK